MSQDAIVAGVIGDMAIIIAVSSPLGTLARRCGQPPVIGQIAGGILLGPSVLGRLPGHLPDRMFPAAQLPYLSAMAQVAVAIFMFTVGYEIDLKPVRGHARAVPLVAAGALAVPLVLGSAVAVALRPQFAAVGERHAGSRSFVLFMGAVMSITALPVLAAIVRERGIAGRLDGAVALAAAGVMDVAAWLVLAGTLVGTGHTTGRPWPLTLLLTGLFVALMLAVVRPALKRWMRRARSVLSEQVPMAFLLALASAWLTSSLGLHPVFGAFLAGLTMPRGDAASGARLIESAEGVNSFLIPLFFVVTGLSVDIQGLNGTGLLLLGAVFAAAAAGKVAPAYAAARLGALEPAQAATVAVLVNARGLTELIALNIGLSDGIISRRLFTILVLMALMTTLMTVPGLSLINRVAARRPPSVTPVPARVRGADD